MQPSLKSGLGLLALSIISALFVANTGLLSGQGLTGQISGIITDPSGGAVVGADVQIMNKETGQTRATKSDTQGSFVFTQLLPGTFTLSVTASGFKKYEQPEI